MRLRLHPGSKPSLAAFGLLLFALLLPVMALAWPTDAEWRPLLQGGNVIQDSETDRSGAVNVVPSDGSHPAAYIYNDGTYLFYRLRLDADPTASGGGSGTFQQFGWGFEIDIDQNLDNYEWLIMCDGISSPEVVSLQHNTDQRTLGDPSDVAEVTVASWPMVGNHRILLADTCINDDNKPGCSSPDYFLDFRIPFAVFKTETGLTDNSIVTYFAGSSRSTNNLTDNGADLVAGTDLYTMASDYVGLYGIVPPVAFYDGSVRFVTDLGGFSDLNLAAPGDTVYLRIDDLDLNSLTLPGGTLTVTVTSPSGDSERVTLSATGVQGKYTGTLLTSGTSAGAVNDGTLYLLDGQSATVSYTEAITASLAQRVTRTDTLPFTATGTDIGISKSVDLPVPSEGQLITFTIFATNNGPSAVTALSVTDLLPAGLTYASHSVSQGSYLSASGLWTIGALARNATATLTLRATVNAGTNSSTLTNSASLTSSTPSDSYLANNSASAAIRVGGTDFAVTKSVSNPFPAPGDSISYAVRVLNLGPNASAGVQVSDLLPAGVTYVGHTVSQGSYVGGSGVWSVGSLAVGSSTLLTINATVNAGTGGQTITNTASLTASTQPDSNVANNSASALIRVDFIDLALSKTAQKVLPLPAGLLGSSVAANIGSTVEFVVTLTNNGPHSGSGLVVTDQLPTGLTYVSATPSQGSYISASGLWTVGSLASGASATLTIRATINAGTAGQTLVNNAQITARNQPEALPGNESASARVAVNGTDIAVTKTVSNSNPAPGGSITWTVTVTNNGPNQGSGIQITDIPPRGLTLTSHSASQGSWDTSGGTPSYVWDIGTLNAAASATLNIVTTVGAGTAGQVITNLAMITAEGQADPDETNNLAAASIAVGGTDLAIAKSVDDSTPDVGQSITYTLTASNLGPNTATGVTVSDLLPPEITYQSHTASTGSYTPGTGAWAIGNLTIGASATLTIVAQVRNEDSRLVITNIATISSTTADGNSANDSASADIIINGTNLAVAKTASSATPYVGIPFTFTVTISNTSAKQATGVQIEDLLPAGLTFISSTPSQGSYAAGLWLVGTLNGGASATLVITTIPNAGTVGSTITNSAQLLFLEQIDTDPTDNQASASVVPQVAPPQAILTVVKMMQTVSDPAHGITNPYNIPGSRVRYTIIVSNTGAGATDVDSVKMTDPIPANLAMIVSGPSPVTFSHNPAITGLSFTYASLTDLFDDVEFSTDGTDFSYAPTADANGTDSNVNYLRVNPKGAMSATSGGTNPSFTITFDALIK